MHAPEGSIDKGNGLVALQHGNRLARGMHCGIYTRRGDTNTTGDTEMSIITPAQYGLNLKARYDNYINGQWVAPVAGRYFENVTPVTGQVICEVARSDAADVELALDAAHAAKTAWGKTSVAQRALILHRIADRMEQHLAKLATVETFDNGKPIRETTHADLPLAIDHFRYFAGCIRAQEGSIGEIDATTVAYHFHEPLGVVGQIIPWNFPLLMAAWKIAPALAALGEKTPT
jgi:aldehyde dehydrogenase